jgi:hypothetical protein
MAVTGFRPDQATTEKLQRLQREHHKLTRDVWNDRWTSHRVLEPTDET